MPEPSRPAPVPELLGRLEAPDIAAVHDLVERATAADGTAPLSEHVLLHLPRGGDADVRNLLVRRDAADDPSGPVLAYAHLDVTDEVEGSSAELVVAPRARGRGLGRVLVEELLQHTPDGRLRLWAHGDSAPAAALARSLGFRRSRVLLQMRRALSGPLSSPLPPVVLPSDVRLRTFRPGADEQAWTELNNRAFADHPDQGGWDLAEVRLREQEPWFDPAGFFLAERSTGSGPRLVGFHWTKVHGGHRADEPHDGELVGAHTHEQPRPGQQEPEHPDLGHPDHEHPDHEHPDHEHPDHEHPDHEHHDHPPIGEVYIVGVDPDEQGRGLGPALTLAGLHSLRERGLSDVLLYVDESNAAAVRTYERLGFTRHAVDVMYRRDGGAAPQVGRQGIEP